MPLPFDPNGISIVVFKDGSYQQLKSKVTWELENDPDWLTTIRLTPESCMEGQVADKYPDQRTQLEGTGE